jgi:hypothetical protein
VYSAIVNIKNSIFVTLKEMNRIKYILIFLFSSLLVPSYAQVDDDYAFKNELYGGLLFHTSGWGINYTISKYKTEKSRALFKIDFYSLRDPKEVKVTPNTRGDRFYYGRLNSIFCFDVTYGRKRVLAHNFKYKGVEVSYKYTMGPSILIAKPEYILVVDQASQTPILERYNPLSHDPSNIYGGAPRFSGLSQSSLIPGLTLRTGFSFDYSPYKNYIRMFEVGLMFSYYLKPYSIMAENPTQQYSPNLYLNFLFGRVNK